MSTQQVTVCMRTYSLDVTASLIYAFSKHCSVLIRAYRSAALSYLQQRKSTWQRMSFVLKTK